MSEAPRVDPRCRSGRMTAALELRKAGYKVQVLEFNRRREAATGHCVVATRSPNWRFRADLEFEQGLYFNPGPWRIPYHHRAVLDYCKRLNVALEPFIELDHDALLHASTHSAVSRSVFARSKPTFKDRSLSCLPRRRSRADSMGLFHQRIERFAGGVEIVGRAG